MTTSQTPNLDILPRHPVIIGGDQSADQAYPPCRNLPHKVNPLDLGGQIAFVTGVGQGRGPGHCTGLSAPQCWRCGGK